MLHTRTLSGTLELGGREYLWELRREPQWCTTDGWQGMLIGVRDAKRGGREVLLQFPPSGGLAQRARGGRHRPQIHRNELEGAIAAALAAGWQPNAKGKPFHFDV